MVLSHDKTASWFVGTRQGLRGPGPAANLDIFMDLSSWPLVWSNIGECVFRPHPVDTPSHSSSPQCRQSAALHLQNAPVNLLISFHIKTVNLLTLVPRPCCCSASVRGEAKQTMGVIERGNRWHYWILITSFPRRRRTWQLPGCRVRARGTVCGCVSGRQPAHQVLAVAERRW